MKKKNDIRARLTIYGMEDLVEDRKQLRAFRTWIGHVAKELQTEDPKIFAQKTCRFTMYK